MDKQIIEKIENFLYGSISMGLNGDPSRYYFPYTASLNNILRDSRNLEALGVEALTITPLVDKAIEATVTLNKTVSEKFSFVSDCYSLFTKEEIMTSLIGEVDRFARMSRDEGHYLLSTYLYGIVDGIGMASVMSACEDLEEKIPSHKFNSLVQHIKNENSSTFTYDVDVHFLSDLTVTEKAYEVYHLKWALNLNNKAQSTYMFSLDDLIVENARGESVVAV